MKTLTLCYKCQQLLSEHYDVQPVYDPLTVFSKMEVKKCENCNKKRPDLKTFTVEKKGP